MITLKHPLRIFLLLAVLIVSFQSFKMTRPFAGHFASYQSAMSSIARNMVDENFTDLLNPKTDLLFNGQKSLHLNQYPLSSLFVGLSVKLTKGSYEFWGRFQSLCFHLLSFFFLWRLIRKRDSQELAFIASILYLLSSLNVIYSQLFMSEYLAQFSFLGALYFAYSDRETNKKYLVLSGLFLSIAILNRIHYVLFAFVFLPAIWRSTFAPSFKRAIIFGFCSLLIPVLWYGYTYFAALKSDHMHTSLFMQLAVKGDSKSWSLYLQALVATFKTIFFYVLNPLLVVFFVVGCFSEVKRVREIGWIYIGLFSTIFLLILFPQKIIDQNFYLLPMHFFVTLFSAYGLLCVCNKFKKYSGILLTVIIILSTAYAFRVCFNPIYSFPQQERQDIDFMKKATSIIPPNAKVIMLGNSHPVAAYYIARPVFMISPVAVGQGLEKYRQSSKFQGLSDLQIKAETESRKTLVTWLQSYEKQGGEYLVIFPEMNIATNALLNAHIDSQYEFLFSDASNNRIYRHQAA